MSIVLCKIPKAGLGNQLFPLLRAYCFAELNNLPVLVYNYKQIKLGPWIRAEKNKRKYSGFFNFEKNFFSAQFDHLNALKYSKSNKIIEPELIQIEKKSQHEVYFFNAVPHYEQHFKGLQENRAMVLSVFRKLVTNNIFSKLEKLREPCIAVHIRMGDFKALEVGVEFGSKGATRSPENYFIDMIHSIRKIHGTDLPVSVFTDGRKQDLQDLFALKNIHLISGNNDLTDLLLLSKSKIIVTSAGSTFSTWASFISEAIVIVHPKYERLKIRSRQKIDGLFEGPLDAKDEYLVHKIKSIST